MKRESLTLERLRQVLLYDPESGVFTRLVTTASNARAGSVAGSLSQGYLLIMIDGVRYQAHRLAWLYMTGEWPTCQVDHSDLNRSNNAFENLRDASRSQNYRNTGPRRSNKSGFKGASLVSGYGNKWQATICVDGKKVHLGCFDSPEAANAAYEVKARLLFGDFARAK